MKAVLSSFLSMLHLVTVTSKYAIEILALRHQLAVLQRQKKLVSLRAADRLLWVLLSRIWNQWRSAQVVVKPETVIAWHRKGFRLSLPKTPSTL
jgi:putative transposase